ncbi:MAG: hypothetical protein O7C75_02050 [Verrucomicrobia bacterium]|nr:hypothetical protein [Verrucomicrobiota bacterium]
MKTNQDRLILYVAGLTALMLLLVLTGDLIPIVFRLIVHTGCIMGIISIMMLRNVLSDSRAAVIWRLYALGLVIMSGIILTIIFLHERFETGDPLLLGMEPGTTLLVFGISLFPFWFIVLWVIGFRRAIVPLEKEHHLNQLKSERAESREDADG